jgi:hypothetical protein
MKRPLPPAVALARLIFALRKSESTEQPFIVAVLLTRRMTADRYIVVKLHSESDEVVVHRLSIKNHFIDFSFGFLFRTRHLILLKKMVPLPSSAEMYNLSSMLESILDSLDVKKCNELEAVKQDPLGIKTFHTSSAWKKTNKSESRGGRTDSIPEMDDARDSGEEGLGSEPEDEDDLGGFGNDNIRAALSKMNYQVAYVDYGACASSIA